ncbi:MAG: valine--tRNA ligase [Thermodesulfobacteriota bacterium]
MDETTTRIPDSRYNPLEVEKRWLSYWEDAGLTRAEATSGRPAFSMVIPPPNITGALHVGHALNSTLQDILARYKRMKGFNVLWIPGIDHAGIATQNVVERELAAEGTDRHATGREPFIERVWEWKQKYGDTILNQLGRLGATCDWSRLRFTMDEGLSRAVREVFVTLYKEGLIYRGDYIINWCPRCRTALSDLEVNFEETEGQLYYMRYPIAAPPAGAPVEIIVATTRPETLLGDTAVAVNPGDSRYAPLIGKKISLPFTGREIPVISDEHVSMEFGTGAVKITPAHDFDDFDMGRRHNLESITVMDLGGVMNEDAGRFKGQDRFKARKEIIKALSAEDLLEKTEPHKLMLGSCYRCSTVVEPTLSRQWFVNVKPLAGPAIKAVKDGRVRFVPKNWENLYFDWMDNIRDWCISRQIWWGHRIPAWHCEDCAHTTVAKIDPGACEKCGGSNIEQDHDVLDTWFSSALWPFSTLGWPEKTAELASFYPTNVLSTSFDIIFFWVARMIMMGLKFMDDVPFRDIYIHALIRDSEGQKMSKSKGNVIDPLVMIEEYGTDAFRFTLAVLAAQGRDIKLSAERIEGYRNFCNKIWNLTRFTLMNMDGPAPPLSEETPLSDADKWILTRLSVTVSGVTGAIDSYRFDEAARLQYGFVWHELCDWYVELSKKDLRGEGEDGRKDACLSVLTSVLRDTLKLLHPFMPFITEEIHSFLPGAPGSLLAEAYPEAGRRFDKEAAGMELVMDLIKAVRNIKTDMNVTIKTPVTVYCFSKDKSSRENLTRGLPYIENLAGVKELIVGESGQPPADSVSARAGEGAALVEIFVPMEGLVDVEVEGRRLEKALQKVTKEYESLEKKLSNKAFVEKAPEAIVEKERSRLKTLLEKKASIETGLSRLAPKGGLS